MPTQCNKSKKKKTSFQQQQSSLNSCAAQSLNSNNLNKKKLSEKMQYMNQVFEQKNRNTRTATQLEDSLQNQIASQHFSMNGGENISSSDRLLNQSAQSFAIQEENLMNPFLNSNEQLAFVEKRISPQQRQRRNIKFYQMFDSYQSMQSLVFQKMKTIGHKSLIESGKRKTQIHWMKTIPTYLDNQQFYQNGSSFSRNKQPTNENLYDQAYLGAKSSLLLLKQIEDKDIEFLRIGKQGFFETKQRIEKNDRSQMQDQDERTCKICSSVFEDGRQLGGHMSKKHPGRSYQYKIRMLVKSNKSLQNERRLYFRLLKNKKDKDEQNSEEKNKNEPKKTKKIAKPKKKNEKKNEKKKKKPVQIVQQFMKPDNEQNQFLFYEEE